MSMSGRDQRTEQAPSVQVSSSPRRSEIAVNPAISANSTGRLAPFAACSWGLVSIGSAPAIGWLGFRHVLLKAPKRPLHNQSNKVALRCGHSVVDVKRPILAHQPSY